MQPHRAADRITTIGLAALMGMAYRGDDLNPVWAQLAQRIDVDAQDTAALLDMSAILQLTGQRERGLQVQQVALQLNPLCRRVYGQGTGLRVLAIAVPGDFMANIPLDFLLQGSAFELLILHVHPTLPLPRQLPDHDVAFVVIGESAENRPILAQIPGLLAGSGRPVLNRAADRIASLSRDGVCGLFSDDPHVFMAKTVRCARASLAAIDSPDRLSILLLDAAFPIIVRPIDTHAGSGLAKLDSPAAIAAYLQDHAAPEFYIAPYVDYRSPDGLFRKQRIAFIDGRPFISHMAISSHWMVHYLSAGMDDDAAKRAEEAAFFEHFDTHFAVRHRLAFESLHRRMGLDYFGIDCAELPDGRLFLFEADVAMIVHALDAETLYPYKKPAMARLFHALHTLIETVARRRLPEAA